MSGPPSSGGNIKVVVRCRPLNSREIARGDSSIISMSGPTTTIDPPPAAHDPSSSTGRATERKPMNFAFDHSYWSAGPKDAPGYASQETLYRDVGLGMLDHSFGGYHTCVFAYGQTGSGKSYSMMGYGEEKGVIPLVCAELFARAERTKEERKGKYEYTVETSYIEIYNEKVRDLLNPKNKGNLRVREHPSLGPYVEDLSQLIVGSYDDIMNLMDEGNKARTVAATQMNETSSRSHAVFTLIFTQKVKDDLTGLDAEKVSRISLVDLAGSERANSTGATGARLKEGANINKSLTTLGKVIAALAAASASGKKKKEEHIPFRDSVLTWLLKDCLGGNSQTTMIAAIAPSSASYEETLSTLRYADQTKKIKTRAVVNEDPNAKMIRELKEELEMLRTRVSGGGEGGLGEATFDPSVPPEKQMVSFLSSDGEVRTISKAELQEQVETSEKLLKSVNESWEEKIHKTEEARKEREQALEELGITVEKGGVGVHTPKKMPHLVNLNEDPLMSECLVYQLKPGNSKVGNVDIPGSSTIKLSGAHILAEHCTFVNENGIVTVDAVADSLTIVNGKRVLPGKPQRLRSGFRVILGDYHVFRFNNPEEVRKQRDLVRTSMSQSFSAPDLSRPESPSSTEEGLVDWQYAKRELALARLNGQDPALDHLRDEDLDKLFDDLQKVRTLRKRPESRLSMGDDLWDNGGGSVTRHLSSNFTDDTSVDPNAPNPWGGLESLAEGTTDVEEEKLKEINDKLADYESQLPALQDADSVVEKQQMEAAISMMSLEVKRLMAERAQGSFQQRSPVFEPQAYSAKEIRLAKKVIEKWKSLRTFAMAEQILRAVVEIKEANVLSRRMQQDVTYNFLVSDAAPTSALNDFLDVDETPVSSVSRPTIYVKVLDFRSKAVYLWVNDHFKRKLSQMRNVTSLTDKPSVSGHFSAGDAFSDGSPSDFSCVGKASVPLVPLFRFVPFSGSLPIFCPFTAEAIGSCRVTMTMTTQPPLTPPLTRGLGISSPSASSFTSSSNGCRSALDAAPVVGSRIGFVITVDDVKGITSLDFDKIHLQTQLSSFTGTFLNEEVYPSSVVDLNKHAASHLSFRRKFSFVVTAEVAEHLRSGYARIDLFAKCHASFLERLTRWDDLRELLEESSSPGDKTSPTLPSSGTMRRSESDFVQEETHDISSRLQLLEIDSSGQWAPVQVLAQSASDAGSFFIQQGLQRRIRLFLLHGSGKALKWLSISRTTIGQVRLLDREAATTDKSQEVELKLLPVANDQEDVVFHPDGTSTLTADALWDSSAHDSLFLNRPSPSGQRVLLRFTFLVQIESAEKPAVFSHDFSVKVQARGAAGPGYFSTGFFSSNRLLQQTTSLFSLVLSPSPTRSSADLWRLDTSQSYVRGEEFLPQGWKLRGVSTVKDFLQLRKIERLAADVRAVESFIASCDSPSSSSHPTQSDDEVKKKVLNFWTSYTGRDRQLDLSRRIKPSPSILSKYLDLSPKFTPTVSIARRSDVVAKKKGYLDVLVDSPNNVWAKRFCVLRRPYLHLYKSNSEADEVSIINLSGDSSTGSGDLTIVSSPEVEQLLGRKHAFTVFARSNSYVFQATSEKDEAAWRETLAPNTYQN